MPLGMVSCWLDEWRAAGIAEEVEEGRWRLTASADRWLGRALRELDGGREVAA